MQIKGKVEKKIINGEKRIITYIPKLVSLLSPLTGVILNRMRLSIFLWDNRINDKHSIIITISTDTINGTLNRK